LLESQLKKLSDFENGGKVEDISFDERKVRFS
jgi:hypothetical protein